MSDKTQAWFRDYAVRPIDSSEEIHCYIAENLSYQKQLIVLSCTVVRAMSGLER